MMVWEWMMVSIIIYGHVSEKNAGDCNLQVCFALCPCDWHTLYTMQGLFKPIARLMIKDNFQYSKSPLHNEPAFFACFFFSQHLLLKGPYSQEMLYWKSQGHNVRCHLREENSNVVKIVSTVVVMIFRPPFGSKPLPVLWTSNGGPRHEENGLWKNVRLEMMVENAVVMWEKHAIWPEPTKSEKDRRSTKAKQIIGEMFRNDVPLDDCSIHNCTSQSVFH